MKPRILLANVTLGGRTGTEVVTHDLAVGFARRGLSVQVYSPQLGPLVEAMRLAGAIVVSDLTDLRETPDVIEGHHLRQTLEAVTHFSETPALFVCHDPTAGHSIPPRHAQVRRFVAVDRRCHARLTDQWSIPVSQTRIIANAVDLGRFLPRNPLPAVPARALVFGHYAGPGPFVDAIREACAARGITVDVAGSAAASEVAHPERVLGQYDVVFAKGRCALEAMAVGASVVLCSLDGLRSTVTRAEVAHLREWNFGSRTFDGPVTLARLARALDQYDPADAAAVSAFIREDASLDSALDAYLETYADVIADWTPASRRSRDAGPAGMLDVLETLAARVQWLERRQAEFERPDRMHALEDDECRALKVAIDEAPRSMAAAETAYVRVHVDNGTRNRRLGSWPPHHLHWSSRWRRAEDAEPAPGDHERTWIRTAVAPGETGYAVVRVTAPREPGRYALRLTLVQEGVRWLDASPIGVFAEADVDVVPSPALSQPSSIRSG